MSKTRERVAWDEIDSLDSFKNLRFMLKRYAIKIYPTSIQSVYILENGEKKGLTYPNIVTINGKDLTTSRKGFWNFSSLSVEDQEKEIPQGLISSNDLIISLHRDMSLVATLRDLPSFVYEDGFIYKKLGEIKNLVAHVAFDGTFSHIFLHNEHIVRCRQYLDGIHVPPGTIPLYFNFLKSRVVSLYLSKNQEDLLEKSGGFVKESFHPCYQVESGIGSFMYYAINPTIIEFKEHRMSIILPPSFDNHIDNVLASMSSIPSGSYINRVLEGYVVGPMILKMMS